MNAPHMEYRLAPQAIGTIAWIETFVLPGLFIALGFWLSPEDPLQVNGNFPWAVLVPVLLGVRYGFVHGLLGAGLVVLTYLLLANNGLPAYQPLSPSFIVGMLVCGMLVGEVRDLWWRRLQRLQMANEYRQYRLDEFTRAHQILRVSHDRLEQRIAGSDQSLRSSLLGLRERLRALPGEQDVLGALAEPILTLLSQYGSLRVAGLYRVDDNGAVQRQPLESLGAMGELPADDLLVRLCLTQRELVSVREDRVHDQPQGEVSTLQVCVPLLDTEGQLLAILAVRQMPFFAFQNRTLSLLALLAGHIADLLHRDPVLLTLADPDAQNFSRQLKRSLIDVERHELSAYLHAFEFDGDNDELVRLFERSQRGLDLQLRLRNRRGRDCLLVLLPLTSALGAEGYLTRLNSLVGEHFGQQATLQDLGVQTLPYNLEAAPQRAELRHFLFNECGLNDQQVAV